MSESLINTVISKIICRLPILERNWYRSQYPDVTKSRMSATTHFRKFGSAEGRIPNQAVADLWARNSTAVIPKLLTDAARYGVNAAAARWILARWYAYQGAWQKALALYDHIGAKQISRLSAGQRLLLLDALVNCQQQERAQALLEQWQAEASGRIHDWWLAKANMVRLSAPGASGEWLACINTLYRQHGLADMALREHESLQLDNLCCENAPGIENGPLVSVIMPVRNGAPWITTALDSLLQQTWQDLEIIVVDDASTDETVAIVDSYVRLHSQVKLLKQLQTGGTYAARNVGLNAAMGEFVTVHDADDWSHCEKIAQQVKALQDSPAVMASVSHWVRATTDLMFGGWHTPENWNGWIHRNVSSLMLRRVVIEQLGYWDVVKCNADVEYYYRVMHAYGRQAVIEVLSGVPLAMGRSHAKSLTQQSATNVFTVFGGVRKTYHQAFNQWHEQASNIDALYLPQYPQQRPFPAPPEMLV